MIHYLLLILKLFYLMNEIAECTIVANKRMKNSPAIQNAM